MWKYLWLRVSTVAAGLMLVLAAPAQGSAILVYDKEVETTGDIPPVHRAEGLFELVGDEPDGGTCEPPPPEELVCEMKVGLFVIDGFSLLALAFNLDLEGLSIEQKDGQPAEFGPDILPGFDFVFEWKDPLTGNIELSFLVGSPMPYSLADLLVAGSGGPFISAVLLQGEDGTRWFGADSYSPVPEPGVGALLLLGLGLLARRARRGAAHPSASQPTASDRAPGFVAGAGGS
jgi:hypothetical protein